METLIITLFLVQHILCGNLEKDLLSRQALQNWQLYDLNKILREDFVQNVELQAIQRDDISLYVYTKAKPDGSEIHLADAEKITEVSPFNPELKTVFFIHGWLQQVSGDSCTLVRDSMLETSDVNLININWDKCANSIDYFVSQGCVADVGKYLGEFIETVSLTYNYSLSDVTVVGHSLGAHIAGHAGKYTNGSLGVIVALDAAGPFYFKDIRSSRLTEEDAQYVQGIHTDAIFLGVNFNVGHADFWPNGGFGQKGCGLNAGCSHKNAYRYYAESLTNNEFFAKNCDSYNDYKDGKCDQNSMSIMAGINVNTSATGTYYLETNPESPFGMGDI